MGRKKSGDFPPEVLKLFDGYVHGALNRREFIESAGKFAVGRHRSAHWIPVRPRGPTRAFGHWRGAVPTWSRTAPDVLRLGQKFAAGGRLALLRNLFSSD